MKLIKHINRYVEPSNSKTAKFVYILVFLVPFSVYSISLGGGVGLTPANIFAVVLLLLFVLMSLMKGTIPDLTLLWPLFLTYILIAMIGALFVEDRFVTLRGVGAYLKMAIYFLFPIVFLKTRDHVEKCIYAFIIAGLLSAVMGWVELIGYYFFGKVIFPPFAGYFHDHLTTKAFGFTEFGGMGAFGIPGFVRMFGFMNPGSNIFGAYMVIPFCFSLYLALRYKKRGFLWLVALFLGVTIVASVSRNAILGLAVFALCAYILTKLLKGQIFGVMFRVFTIFLFIVMFVTFSYVIKDSSFFDNARVRIDESSVQLTPNYLVERFNPFLSKSAKKSSRYFTDHLSIATEHCLDNAGFGLGLQNFDKFAYENYPVIGYSCHSNFITFLGDTGIWGFLIQVLIVLVAVRYGIIAYKTRHNVNDNLSVFLTSLYLALVVIGIVRTYYLADYTFLVMGFIAKLYLINRGQKETVST